MPIYKMQEQVKMGEPTVRCNSYSKVPWRGKERAVCREPFYKGEFSSDDEAIAYGKRQMTKNQCFKVWVRNNGEWVLIEKRPEQCPDPNLSEGEFRGEL